MMQSVPDPYRVLGVARDATASQIKAAHRRLAKRHHPDAPEGDTTRFLAIQHAYQVLADPLARRDWDARHQAGPWRADERATPGSVRERRPFGEAGAEERAEGVRGGRAGARAAGTRPATAPGGAGAVRGAAGGATGSGPGSPPGRSAPGPDRPGAAGSGGSGRDPAAGSYTWSAWDVPWWEEGRSQGARRPPGRRRPRTAGPATGSPGAAGQGAGRPAGGRADGQEHAAPGRGRPTRGTPPRAGAAHPGPAGEAPSPPEMDVYSRSSGAAWSSAARAYFRRHELPRPGRRSAWARTAAGPAGRPAAGEADSPPATGPGAPDAARPAFAPGADAASGAATHRRRSAPAPAAGGRPGHGAATRTSRGGATSIGQSTARPASAGFGVRRAAVWAAADRGAAYTGDWPPLPQRVILALLAWAPLALAVAYGGDALSGCGRGAVSCPPYVPPLQLAVAIGLLGLLLVAPRGAYLAAAGTIGLALGSAAALFIIAVLTAGGTVPELFVAAGFGLAFLGYAVAVQQAARDTPFVRPWLARGADDRRPHRPDGPW